MNGKGIGPLEAVAAPAGAWTPVPGEEQDVLELEVAQALRPFGRYRTAGGRDILLALPRGARLEHGDLLWRGGGVAVVVALRRPPVALLRLPEGDPAERMRLGLSLAHFLGNQHLPMRVTADGALRVPVEDPHALAGLLAGSSFSGVSLTVVPGEAEDPLPNPHAHVHA
ncbi:UreE_N domain-containing protein [Candidatus Hydrogenisulfobacillus filiaventi]|uniref:UreE_N domain-containing protein n=1 Tax=Candidatus Hydrogenisulfobacillus filiaventi TaxID=2707344 RepID=A0A6F8ZJ49_9FIRM|nr:urease accessory protein UreE [Bacillota bacterium]CAB1129755.1 UreE_N domain-containing protein [Candidatus Hydrogenisulfobacillus filiaventi]